MFFSFTPSELGPLLQLAWKLYFRGLIGFLSVEAQLLELVEALLSDVAVSTDTKCASPVTGKKLSKQVN